MTVTAKAVKVKFLFWNWLKCVRVFDHIEKIEHFKLQKISILARLRTQFDKIFSVCWKEEMNDFVVDIQIAIVLIFRRFL